jgi:hypothetical protein
MSTAADTIWYQVTRRSWATFAIAYVARRGRGCVLGRALSKVSDVQLDNPSHRKRRGVAFCGVMKLHLQYSPLSIVEVERDVKVRRQLRSEARKKARAPFEADAWRA